MGNNGGVIPKLKYLKNSFLIKIGMAVKNLHCLFQDYNIYIHFLDKNGHGSGVIPKLKYLQNNFLIKMGMAVG